MTIEGIKTLHIIPEGNAPFIELCNHYLGYFPSSKFDSTVLYLIGFNDQKTRDQTNTGKIIFWELKGSSLKLTPANLIRFYQLIKKEKYDLVVCHSHASLIMACLVNILTPVYKIIGISYKNGEFASKFINSFIYLCKKRVRLFGVLKSIQLDICENLKAMPAEYIQASCFSLDYRKIRHERLSRAEAKTRLNIRQGRFVFGVRHESGVDDDIFSILTAFSYTREKIKQGVLVVFCERKHQTTISKKVKALLIESVVIFRYDLTSFSHYSRVFDGIIVTCNPGNVGIGLLQSMVSGLPVIATKLPANIEYIGKAGYLYDRGDAYQLTYYMELLYSLTPEERMELKKKVLARINEDFTPQVCRQKFQALPMVQKFLYEDI